MEFQGFMFQVNCVTQAPLTEQTSLKSHQHNDMLTLLTLH